MTLAAIAIFLAFAALATYVASRYGPLATAK